MIFILIWTHQVQHPILRAWSPCSSRDMDFRCSDTPRLYWGRLGNELRHAAQSKAVVNPKAKEFVCKTSISTSPKDVQKVLFFSIVIYSCCKALTLIHLGPWTLMTHSLLELGCSFGCCLNISAGLEISSFLFDFCIASRPFG